MERIEALVLAQRLVDYALDLLKEVGQGAVQEFERQAERGRSFVADRRKAGDMKLSHAFQLADYLGRTLPELIEDSGYANEENIIRQRRNNSDQPELIRLTQMAYQFASDKPTELCMPKDLQILDKLRFENPILVLDRLQKALEKCSKQELAYIMGIAASCYRILGRLSDALNCAESAQSLSQKSKNEIALANAYQRMLYLLIDIGCLKSALRKSRESTVLYSELDRYSELGETLIDRGVCFFHLSNYERSLSSYSGAQRFSEYLSARNKVALLQGISACHVKLGRLAEAVKPCQEASKLAARTANPLLVGKCLWVGGLIKAEAGQTSGAVEDLLNAIETFGKLYPLDTVLVIIDLISIYLNSGKYSRAKKLTVSIRTYLPFFEPVSELFDDLWELSAVGEVGRELSPDLLVNSKRTIERSRERYYRVLDFGAW